MCGSKFPNYFQSDWQKRKKAGTRLLNKFKHRFLVGGQWGRWKGSWGSAKITKVKYCIIVWYCKTLLMVFSGPQVVHFDILGFSGFFLTIRVSWSNKG